ncbi:MAG: hypothetical protein L0216_13755 [Planctomycetales bacterium]|nr:hypothetical protein [Planctomycetales bacterium]
MRRAQRALAAGAWLATAAGTGFLASLLFRPAAGLVVVGGEGADSRDGGAAGAPRAPSHGAQGGESGREATGGPPTGEGRESVPPSDGHPTAFPAGGPAAAGAAMAEGPDAGAGGMDEVPCWIEVRVTREDGTAAEAGTVYALPGGEPGTNDVGDLPQADITDGGLARLPVPSEGSYDVGYIGEAHALRTDVLVARGETARIALAIPAGRRFTFRCDKPIPDGRTWHVSLQHVAPETGDAWAEDARLGYPGRTERPRMNGYASVGPGGQGASHPLPVGGAYRIVVGVDRQSSYRLDPEPALAQPGAEVLLRVRPQARLSVGVRIEGRPEPSGWFQLWLQRTDGGGREALADQGSLRLTDQPAPIVRWATPGKARIGWHGYGIAPGTTDEFELIGGRTVEKGIVVRPPLPGEAPVAQDRDASASPRLRVSVEGIPEGGVSERASLYLLARLPGPPPVADYNWHDREQADLEVSEEWKPVRQVLAVLGARLASDPTPVEADGRVAIRLKAAGLLLAVPERPAVSGLGALTLEREDGLPIPTARPGNFGDDFTADDWDLDLLELQPHVGPGTILGPFPEGTIRFRVRLGRVRLPGVAATVKAGALRPLVIPR